MKSFLTNWKTTLAGGTLLALALMHSVFGIAVPGVPMPDFNAATLTIAFGLLFAKDGNVTGGNTKQVLSIALALVYLPALFALTPAGAADMPLKAPIAALGQAANASGFYAGINGGAAIAGQKYDFITLPGTGEINPAGLMTGITLGFGGTAGPSWVAFEADGDYDFTRAQTPCAAGSCKSRDSWLLSQRVVVGVPLQTLTGALGNSGITGPAQLPVALAVPSNLSAATLMPYLTGGIYERNVSACVTGLGCGSEWMVGYGVGGGVRIPVAKGWTGKVQYEYIAFNKHFVPAASDPLFPNFTALNEQRAIVGLDYHF